MVSPIAEWRLLTEAQKVVVTCCTRFTVMKQLEIKRLPGSQRLPTRIKTILSEKSWKYTFLNT
jgi:hypothetical protein